MKVFVTGATKALGLPVVRELLAKVHDVYGLSRSVENDHILSNLGAHPVRANLFNEQEMSQALQGMDAVLHLATKIPAVAKMGTLANWHENDRIRVDGTRTLLNAAMKTKSVQTFVYPGFYTEYADGKDQWVDAQHTPIEPFPTIVSSLTAEDMVANFAKQGRRGISLRLAGFYSAESAGIDMMLDYARMGIGAYPGAKDAYFSMVWIDDAARACVAAATENIPSGIYDVVDDTPLTRQQFFDALAKAVGKKSLFVLPEFLTKMMMGVKYPEAKKSIRLSNKRLKEVSSWKPVYPDLRESLPTIHKAIEAKKATRTAKR